MVQIKNAWRENKSLGRISLRFGPDDFKKKSIDGLGEDWPISYDDIKPYYDKVDKLIGVFGSKENMYNEPDGFFLPAPKPRLHELLYKCCQKKQCKSDAFKTLSTNQKVEY